MIYAPDSKFSLSLVRQFLILIRSPILGISAFSKLRPILARSLQLPPLFNLLLMILHGSVPLYGSKQPQLPREAVLQEERFLLSLALPSQPFPHGVPHPRTLSTSLKGSQLLRISYLPRRAETLRA